MEGGPTAEEAEEVRAPQTVALAARALSRITMREDDLLKEARKMSLRGELADQLRLAALMTQPPYATEDSWLNVADECLRQMEWAREHGSSEQAYQECEHCTPDPGPLTLAPKDWKP